MDKIKLTKEGLAKLQEEYRYLLDVLRPEITRDLVEARSLGDLSENADYDSARERQGKTEMRILELQAIFNNYELIKTTNSIKKVSVGSIVTLKDLSNNEEEEYEIVGNIEADPLSNRISHESPVARAILDCKVGDIVEVQAPIPYKIEIMKLSKK